MTSLGRRELFKTDYMKRTQKDVCTGDIAPGEVNGIRQPGGADGEY